MEDPAGPGCLGGDALDLAAAAVGKRPDPGRFDHVHTGRGQRFRRMGVLCRKAGRLADHRPGDRPVRQQSRRVGVVDNATVDGHQRSAQPDQTGGGNDTPHARALIPDVQRDLRWHCHDLVEEV